MEVQRNELLRMQRAHADAAMRLRRAMRDYPSARRGLAKCAQLHEARAVTLAREIHGAAGPTRKPAAPIASSDRFGGLTRVR